MGLVTEMSQQQELDFIGDFDPNEEELEEETRYVFDPDTPDNKGLEEIEFDPEKFEVIDYDPRRKKRRKKRAKTKIRWRTRARARVRRVYVKAKARRARPVTPYSRISKFLPLIGGLLAFVIPTWAVWKHYKTVHPELNFGEWVKQFWSHEVKLAIGLGGTEWPITKYWSHKLFDMANSAWAGVVIASTIGVILTKLKILNIVSPKLNSIVGKLAIGAIIAGLIGAFMVPAAYHGSPIYKPEDHYSTQNNYGGISEEEAYKHVLNRSPF